MLAKMAWADYMGHRRAIDRVAKMMVPNPHVIVLFGNATFKGDNYASDIVTACRRRYNNPQQVVKVTEHRSSCAS